MNDKLAFELTDRATDRLGLMWQERMIAHIATKLDQELREGAPLRQPPDVQAAQTVIKQLAEELKTASTFLYRAAHVLRDKGLSVAAGATHQAAERSAQVARNVLGDTSAGEAG
jgi:hypothetical protein